MSDGVFTPMSERGRKLAGFIDHTLLKPEAAEAHVVVLCREARHYGFAAVCVNPVRLETVVRELEGARIAPCTVVGFPLGSAPAGVKAFEAAHAVGRGATELDMVLAIGLLKDRRYDAVREDMAAVVRAAGPAAVKVILETHLLSDDEKRAACELAVEAGARFVKTSTGFTGGGATPGDVRLMREVVGDRAGVKASGGIRTAGDAEAMVASGASRIGTSAGVAIVTQ